MFRKTLSLFLAVSLLFSMMIFSTGATASALSEESYNEKKEYQELIETKSNINLIIPVTVNNITTYYDQNHNEVDITVNNRTASIDESSLPESYDLRDEGRVTSVKDQGSEGFCWNFATTASMESSILSNPELRAALGKNGAEALDLSEAGNAWYINTSIDDEDSYFYDDTLDDIYKGSKGGDSDIVAQGLSSGFGAYPEELMPYSSWGTSYSEALRFYSDYRLKEYVVFENDMTFVKDRLMQFGALYLSYHSFPSNYYFNDEGMQSYYTDGSPINPNDDLNASHAVTLIGWDDNFSRENFAPEMRPENDGAWLIKNSWGEYNGSYAEGYEGYFWMSYESEISDFAQYTMQSAQEFDNIYQHQFTTNEAAEVKSAANVFTAEKDEILREIYYSNYLPASVTVEIYRLNENYTNPADGELLATFDGSTEFSGAHTIEVPEIVELKAGDIFSVVLKSEDMFNINLRYTSDVELENKSFVFLNDTWKDVADEYGLGYLSIKAYTSNKDGAVYKDELSALINKAENYEFNENVGDELKENLNLALANAKEVLSDNTATQNTVDNTYCLLGDALSRCDFAYFEINSKEDFLYLYKKSQNGFYSDANIVLNTDLDLKDEDISYPLFNNGAFNGIFDGNGHTISNLDINSYSASGLFYKLKGATVKNLKLLNSNFSSSFNTGTIAGEAESSTISNCVVTNAEIISSEDIAGGIVGIADWVTVSDCKVEGSKIVSKSNMAGGIAGSFYAPEVNNCSITNTEILALSAITLFASEEVYNCTYENITLKTFQRIRFTPFSTVINICEPEDCGVMLVFENDKLTLVPYIGKITDATSDEASITKVGENYEIEFDRNSYAIINTTFEPVDTNNFTFSFDFLTNEATLNSYCNFTDETATEIVFPSYIGKLSVTELDFNFEIDSVAPVKSLVLPENLSRIDSFVFYDFKDLESVTISENTTYIGYGAFAGCDNIKDVYYGGTEEQWADVTINEANQCLKNATIHFAQEESTPAETTSAEATTETTAVTEPEESSTATEPAPSTVTDPEESSTATESAPSTVTDPVESTTVTEPSSTVTEPVESTVVTEPSSTVTEPVESTTVTEPSSTVTEPVESTVVTEPTSVATEPTENSTVTEPTEETTTTQPQPEYEVGDVNKDGKVNIKDATAIQKYLAKLVEFDATQLILADCNKDNKVNIKDVTYIQKKIAKLI